MTLELASFWIQASIGVAAWIALLQITQSRRNFKTNSDRESIKYSAELVKYYLSDYVRFSNEAFHKHKEIGFVEYFGEVQLLDFSRDEIMAKENESKTYFLKVKELYKKNSGFSAINLNSLNALEIFATPFIARVADEGAAFTAVGQSFCKSVEHLFYDYCQVRDSKRSGYNYYSNTIELYNLWKPRIYKTDLEKMQEEIKSKISALPAKIIKALGS